MEELVPMGSGISVGSIFGVCTGFALKKAGRAAAVVVGGVFIFQQGLAHMGYVKVDWAKVEKDVTALLDQNGDGKLDEKDMASFYIKAIKMLETNNAAISGGFGAGFLYGMRKG